MCLVELMNVKNLNGECRWSLIAGRLPGRTDNEIKNYWNTHIRRKLLSRGIDPTTHRPLNDPSHNQSHIASSASAAHHQHQHSPDQILIKDENNKRVEVCPDLNLELTISLPHHNHQSSLTSNNNNGGSSTAGDGYDFLGLKSGTVLDCRSSITQIDWRALKEWFLCVPFIILKLPLASFFWMYNLLMKDAYRIYINIISGHFDDPLI